jgi:serine/threonine protein kinase/WD40 repeat protein
MNAAGEPRPDDRTTAHPPSASSGVGADPRLAQAVEEYQAALKAGRAVDRQALRARCGPLAAALEECLDAVDLLYGAAGGFGPSPTGGADEVVAAVRTHEPVGDFRIVREVGRGGMGVVYEAEQVSLRRRVALKVLPLAAVIDPRQLQRFRNEAQAAACLHHPHIVPVYAVGVDRGVHYYAMQFIDGRTLAAVIAELAARAGASEPTAAGTDGPPAADRDAVTAGPAAPTAASTLPPPRSPAFFRTVARLGVQAARALDYAHERGVVHRDVKPANLLLDGAGNVWVTDFGLAHFQGSPGLTMTGDLVGTLRYMSPEQAGGKRSYVDHRTDVYSLGLTLYELLALEPAFPGCDRQEVLRQVAEHDPPPVRRRNPAAPVELETIIAKAAAKVPTERYATAQELADDLQRFLDDQPIHARRPGLLARGRKWARRHRPIAASLALSLALLAAGAVIGLLLYAQEQHDLARERGEFALLKQAQEGRARNEELRAKQDLYRTLLGEATALRQTREPGYRPRVWKDLHDAVRLGVPEPAPEQVRAEVLACLGDPIGLEPVQPPPVVVPELAPVPEPFQKLMREQFDRDPLAIAVSPDGQLLATCGEPRNPNLRQGGSCVLVWDRQGGVRSHALFLGLAYDLRFSPDGRSLVAGCEQGVIRWAVPGGVITSWGAGTVTSVAVHPGGRLLATAGRRLELWSMTSNRLIASFPSPRAGTRVEFSSDGRWLLAVSRGAAEVAWPVRETPEKRCLDGHGGGVPALAWSPDGTRLASASKDQAVRIWDVATGRLLHDCPGHAVAIEAIAYSPDGRWLASGDLRGGVRLWDAATGAPLAQAGMPLNPPGQVWRLQFAPGGKFLAAGGGKGVAAWVPKAADDGVSLEPLLSLPTTEVYDLAVHPAGEQIVFLDKACKVRVWDLPREAEQPPLAVAARLEVRGLHFDAAGRRLTYITATGMLGLWDWPAGPARVTGQPVFQLALDPTGRWAATSGSAQNVRVYDVEAGREVLSLPSEGADVWNLAWSPDGTRLAVGLSDGGVNVWDLEQVRARLLEFGIDSPSTRVGAPAATAPRTEPNLT